MSPAAFRKALVAAAGAALFAVLAGLGAGLSDGDLDAGEALTALGAGATAAAVVGRATFVVPNAGRHRADQAGN